MRVGTLCYATAQGLGYLAKAFYDNGVVTHPRVFVHSSKHSRPTNRDWYPVGTPVFDPSDSINTGALLENIDVMLFFETPFYWRILHECRSKGIKTALVTMYEWTPQHWPARPDMVICPSLLDMDYLCKEFPKERCVFIPVPTETKYWKLRTTAARFLHNAGNVGYREHKGTRELLQAIPMVREEGFRLTVRGQDARALAEICDQCPRDPRVEFQFWEVAYKSLWDNHDVYIAPEKFNGLSLPLQEAYSAGMLVMTSNRYPHNTWLPNDPLIPVRSYHKARVSGNYLEFDEAEVAPEDIARTIDAWFGKDILPYSLAGKEWASMNSWEHLKPRYLEALGSLFR